MASNLPFTQKQLIILILFGITLWFLAAMLLRVLGPMGIYEGSARFILYALIIPGSWPFVWIAKWIAELRNDQIFSAVAVATMAAALCDGLALAWFPALYAATPELVAGAGGTILWGAGVIMALGFWMNKPAVETSS